MQCNNADVVDVIFEAVVVKFADKPSVERPIPSARLAISSRSIAFCSLSSVREYLLSGRWLKIETSQYRSPDFRVFDTLPSHDPVRLNSS